MFGNLRFCYHQAVRAMPLPRLTFAIPRFWSPHLSNRPSVRAMYVACGVICFALVVGLLRGADAHNIPSRLSALFQIAIAPPDGPADATVFVDATVPHQTLDGFGQAEPSTLVYQGAENLSDSLRAIAVEKAYSQVGINMGIIGSLLESPSDYSQLRNDDNDPLHINWAGFSPYFLNNTKQFVVDLAKPYGFTNYYLGAEAPNVRWASPWLAELRQRDYNAYLDEVAEQVLANVAFWKNTYGEELPYYQLGNEQLSGNYVMINPDLSGFGPIDPVQQIVDIAKRAGSRLRNAGFAKTRFMVGTEETEAISLQVATAVLSASGAREYVGAIGYHSYPYYEGYSSTPFILNTSGAGVPDRARIAVRNQIRDLGEKYGVQVWMTENSHAGDPLSYQGFRARAIQIHDEFLYAGASAYFAENAVWDLRSQRLHSGSEELYQSDNEGNVVLINNDTGAVDITGIGYAIGHYARWIKPGSVRIDATSVDPLVQVTAFRNDNTSRVALVMINNSRIAKNVTVNLTGLALTGDITGEQSSSAGYWYAIAAFAPASSASFAITLPELSVTSVGVSWSGGADLAGGEDSGVGRRSANSVERTVR
jgi:Glycosyl hydrolase family 30 beta sandwich domain